MSVTLGHGGSGASGPYWEATRDRRLVLQRCQGCAGTVWYPRAICPHCLSDELVWDEVSGTGTVYSVSIHYRAPSKESDLDAPYAVALVDLDAGARVLSNVVNCDPETVRIGARVRATWTALADGRNLLRFEPDHP